MSLLSKFFPRFKQQETEIRFKPIQSDRIAETAYVYESKTLLVRFHDGAEKQYFHVPPRIYNELLNAPSADLFFQSFIERRFHSF